MLIAQKPTLTETKISENRSQFVIEPLEPGFGYTIGNSLRRTLLSSIPGAAITNIQINGVLHEFSTLKGIREDVTEIVMSLKEVVVSSEHNEPQSVTLTKKGAGVITAGDIVVPSGVEIHNKDLHIATVNENGDFHMEMMIERGRGYVSAAQNKQSDQVGLIPIDSIYSPVVKVAYKVESARMESRTDFDKLILDIETKYSITPSDALSSAAGTLVNLFGHVNELNKEVESIEIGGNDNTAGLESQITETQWKDKSIEDLNLNVRANNHLRESQIFNVSQLIEKTEAEVKAIKHLGAKTVEEIKNSLAEVGLTLKANTK